MRDPRRPDFVGVLTLVGIVALCLLGYWAFPHIQDWLAHQDCVATGRMDCTPH